MALIVLDPCSLGLNESPEGVVLQISDVEGFEGHKFILPIGAEQFEKIAEAGKDIIKGKPQVVTADLATMKEEVKRGGTSSTSA